MPRGLGPNWGAKVRYYCINAFPEMIIGMGIVSVVVYKHYYGRKEPVDDKPSN